MSLATRIRDALRVLAGYHLQQWSPDRPNWVPQSQVARKDIPYAVRRSIVNWGRELERRDPLFNRYLDLCQQYVSGPTGMRIVSGSSDSAWAARANAAWSDWEPYCDLGSRFSFGQRQSLIVREERTVGEVFIHLTTGSTDRPRLQFFATEQIETPQQYSKDEAVSEGIRYDQNGRPVSYYLKVSEKEFKEIPAEAMVHIYDPSRIGQGRGLSVLYPSLKDAVDLDQLQDFEMLAAKDAARTSKVVKTASGEVDSGQLRRAKLSITSQTDTGTETKTASQFYQQALGAETVVMRHGDEYAQFASNRPSVAMQSFWDFVTSRYCAGLGIPAEIILLRSMQGTVTRAALDMANGFFRCQSSMLAEHFGRIWEYVVLKTVKGQYPPDWKRIRYTPPRSINVDVGRNSSAMIAEWQSGFRTLEDIAGELGKDWRDILRQRDVEFQYARELEAASGIPATSILQEPNKEPQPAQPTA